MFVYVPPSRLVPMVILSLAVTASTFAAPPALHFEERSVVLSGATPDGAVAVLGVGRDRVGFESRLLTLWDVVPVGPDGVGRLDLDLPVPADSAWIAVDLASGEIAVTAADPSALRVVSFPSRGIPASLDSLDDSRSRLAVLWVRPDAALEAGAWGGRVQDGGPLDGDGSQNRGLEVRLRELTPLVEASAPPAALRAGDVLAAVDLDTLDLYVATLAP